MYTQHAIFGGAENGYQLLKGHAGHGVSKLKLLFSFAFLLAGLNFVLYGLFAYSYSIAN